MKTSKISALKAKFHTARKLTIPVLFILSSFSVNTMAMGRNDAPCKLGDDCAATIYYHICNNNRLCFWY